VSLHVLILAIMSVFDTTMSDVRLILVCVWPSVSCMLLGVISSGLRLDFCGVARGDRFCVFFAFLGGFLRGGGVDFVDVGVIVEISSISSVRVALSSVLMIVSWIIGSLPV
jgi:hypothetical protein